MDLLCKRCRVHIERLSDDEVVDFVDRLESDLFDEHPSEHEEPLVEKPIIVKERVSPSSGHNIKFASSNSPIQPPVTLPLQQSQQLKLPKNTTSIPSRNLMPATPPHLSLASTNGQQCTKDTEY